MSSPIKDNIASAVKDAMRAKNKARLGVLRMLMSEFKKVEVDERIELDDTRVLAILDKAAKQRRDSAQQFSKAGRVDLFEIEQAEILVIEDFLPTALTEDEITKIITQAISDAGASSMQAMGSVMALVKPQVQGRADMGSVSKLVKSSLS